MTLGKVLRGWGLVDGSTNLHEYCYSHIYDEDDDDVDCYICCYSSLLSYVVIILFLVILGSTLNRKP